MTISALASISGTGGQLQFRLSTTIHAGWRASQMDDFINALNAKVGLKAIEDAATILRKALIS